MIDEQDCKIDTSTYGTGPNFDSSVRITHLPTGLSVQCDSEDTQLLNKERAMEMLNQAYEALSKPVPEEPKAPSLEATDAASEAVRKGFRVTLDDIRARVDFVEYIIREHLTIAVIKLDNGWYLVGKSAPVDPANLNAEHGRELAFEDGLRQAWPLLAFAHLESAGA